MTYQDQKNFTFVSEAYGEDTFSVVRFKGTESISRLYEFDITMTANDPDIDARSVLQNPAIFTIVTPDSELPIYGIMSRFEQLQEVDENVFYRGVLVPRFWQSTLSRDNELFLEKNVRGIIEEMMTQAGLTRNDFDIRLTADYPTWEYICQYRESDFAFVSRWMEREGIFYYFEQTDNGEKLIITDSSTSHEDVTGNGTINYVPPSGIATTDEDAVRTLTARQQMLPSRVVLRDYNYRRPTLELRGEADVDAEGGRGNVYIYGEHFKTPEEGNALARVRAEELLCREQVFYGESTAANLRPGYLFELAGHYRESYNQRYLILDVAHKGRQTRFPEGEAESPASEEQGPGYTNQFTAIPADIQFRPERDTPRPRFNGTLNATIDAAGDGQYAEVDDEGRYKVILPFDQSGSSDGKASRWVRMAQPYAGANYGMHFPLHKGTEVLLTFVDGDPDRPIIQGSVPNPDTMSPVTGGNQTSSVIRTGGGNQIRIEDSDGGQQIHLSSPTEGSVISLGAPNEGNIYIKSEGDLVQKIIGPETHRTGGKAFWHFEGPYKKEVDKEAKYTYRNDVLRRTVGNTREEFVGTKFSKTLSAEHQITVGVKTTENLAATHQLFVGAKASETVGATREIFVGGKKSITIAGTSETFVGSKTSKSLAVTKETFVGAKISKCLAVSISNAAGYSLEASSVKNLSKAPVNEITGDTAIRLTCGGSAIHILPGQIVLRSPRIVIDGPGATLDATSMFNIDGNIHLTGNCDMTGFMTDKNIRSK